ncbi:DUF2848 domain-containing protein [uncultured Acinetobacter sp.]|uniref:DUF2848 domain-containing protein n=1 Tax=uncultured Acinetobacter sp. TaxID=165433 RepID=UPI00258D841F|nr:DUF2848 domain-containing protein [uncultured Acinetobacter sp.]
MGCLNLSVEGLGQTAITVDRLIIAGWAGRDRASIDAHIHELAELGVKPPSTVPCFYQVSSELLSTENEIQVIDQHSSGEVECVLFNSDDGLLIAIGSDHTDRKVESYSVAVSKQVCAKPVSQTAWRYADVQAHWDQLIMRSWRVDQHGQELYQQGTTANLLPIDALIAKFSEQDGFPEHTAMFCGTQSVLTQIAHGDEFILELFDPVLNRSLQHRYRVKTLDMVE